ncbi:MAG: alkaline phosphatase family protein, partial [Acidobacteriota bacterium]
MRGDYIDRYQSQWTKGMHRLITAGAVFKRAAYPYMNTVTCPGHATISTGSFPATHGIIGNGWFDREVGRNVRCSGDDQIRTISYAAPASGGDGPSRLLVSTLADEMRAQLPLPTRVVTFSMKERSAIMLAGHRADAATWFNASSKGFVTSSAYTAEPVPFVAAFLEANPIEAEFGKPWTRMLPPGRYVFDDDGLAEKPATYWTPTFPHVLKGRGAIPDADFYEAWETSPFSDAYLGRLGMAAVDAMRLGQGSGTDFLGISFSALDLVGHDFGPASHEVQDVLVRLDATIGALLTHLDRTVGVGNFVVGFSADHGASPIPEQVSAKGLNAGRLRTAAVQTAAVQALQRELGAGTYSIRMYGSELYLERTVLERLRQSPLALANVLGALRSVPGVARAYFGESLAVAVAAGEHDARAAALSYVAGRSGDIIVVPRPYWFYVTEDGTAQPGSATSHGTLYDYAQHVAVIL